MLDKLTANPQRILDLFSGSEIASGTHGLPTLDDNSVKWSIKSTAKTLQEPVTVELWIKHLEGKRPLGVIPIRADGKCLWGSIDVDDYDVDVIEIIKKVVAFKLPLVPCRSKSGGLHLFLFMSEWTDASVVQAKLSDMAALLGYAGCEIFPKQTEMKNGASGNWMCAPYLGTDFGGKIRFQYGLKKTGAEMTLGEFLDVAEKMRVTRDQLEALIIKGTKGKQSSSASASASPPPVGGAYGDGPPCLQALAATGIDSNRNIALFHIGVFLKKAHPTKWEEMLYDDNQKHIKPPLPNSEVDDLRKSLRKKEYQYKCKEQPMASHCNSVLCCTRRFGVGDGDNIPVITGWRKVMLEEPVHYITIKGSETEMEIEHYREINRHQLFIEHCGGQLSLWFPPMKQWVWSMALEEYIKLLKPEPPRGDITEADQLHEMLEDFLTNSWRGRCKEELLDGKPWEDEENEVDKQTRYYFRMRDFEEFCLRRGFKATRTKSIRPKLGNFIRGLGGDGGKDVKLKTKIKDVRVWWVPSAAITKPVKPPPKDDVL